MRYHDEKPKLKIFKVACLNWNGQNQKTTTLILPPKTPKRSRQEELVIEFWDHQGLLSRPLAASFLLQFLFINF